MTYLDAYADPDASYLVILSPDGQAQVRPAFLTLPAGSAVLHGVDSLAGCYDYLARRSRRAEVTR
jgi:uncharacterized protein YbdZ (MbtH family)